ncbi:hypothetical protein CCR75_001580 [Bremia lactucae]|uniref:Ubiquitin carboxyl-terminal hydrolase n=1 Tax=Bremia lactucae TaxID=4779 RepID=A0A976IC49_BRELC|nr:hypothetical protein CCR75_001580 [Bremia lactucae]
MTDWRVNPFWLPWLLLLWWTQSKSWLRRWIKYWLLRPLMRLGIQLADESEEKDATIFLESDGQQSSDSALPGGLVNGGNLCFVNAVLQSLAAIPGFLNGLDRAVRTRSQLIRAPQTDDSQTYKVLVVETLISIMRDLSINSHTEELKAKTEAKEDDGQRLTREDKQQKSRRFRVALSRCTSLVSSAASRQEQQDAEEFLTFLLELLHEVLRVPAQSIRSNEDEHSRFLELEKNLSLRLKCFNPNDPRSYVQAVENLGELRWDFFLRHNASIITDLFSGQMVRGSQCCSCANLTCLHEEQRVFSLPIATENGEQTLAKCLETFRQSEELTEDNRVFCDVYCQKKTPRMTQMLLQRVPPVLIIRLQRFRQLSWGGCTEKVDTPVTFPCGNDELLDISMNTFCQEDTTSVNYELVAVCAHLGHSIDSGHYIAYVRHRGPWRDAASSEQWLRIDDENVRVIETTKLRNETLTAAYLLFYSQVPLK